MSNVLKTTLKTTKNNNKNNPKFNRKKVTSLTTLILVLRVITQALENLNRIGLPSNCACERKNVFTNILSEMLRNAYAIVQYDAILTSTTLT